VIKTILHALPPLLLPQRLWETRRLQNRGRWSDGLTEELKTYAPLLRRLPAEPYAQSRKNTKSPAASPPEKHWNAGIYRLQHGQSATGD